MNDLQKMIGASGMSFLSNIEFEEKSPGRFFQKRKISLNDRSESFYVVLCPGVESPVHNHTGEELEETHVLLYGSGKFIIYNNEGSERELVLEKRVFHPIFSTAFYSPDHKYIAGSDGSICIAFERREDVQVNHNNSFKL
jgi:hypothetical protein